MRIQKRIFSLILAAAIAVTALWTGETPVKAATQSLTSIAMTIPYDQVMSGITPDMTMGQIWQNNFNGKVTADIVQTGVTSKLALQTYYQRSSYSTYSSDVLLIPEKVTGACVDVEYFPSDTNNESLYPTVTVNGRPMNVEYYTQKQEYAGSLFKYTDSSAFIDILVKSNRDTVIADIARNVLSYYFPYAEGQADIATTEKTSNPVAHQHHYEWETIVEPTATTDGEEAYRCTCGAELYRIPMSAYNEFNKEILNDIKYAKEGGTVTVDAHQWTSFNRWSMMHCRKDRT